VLLVVVVRIVVSVRLVVVLVLNVEVLSEVVLRVV
jgi:hypothetical protein